MLKIDNIVDDFNNYVSIAKSQGAEDLEITTEELCYIWLANNVLGLIFYDFEVEYNVGKMLYKTIKAIIERKQLTLINTEDYEKYLICLNLIGTDKLNWGTSIRFCWFDDEEIKNYYKAIIDFIDQKLKAGDE